jgi:hypothetical protein
MTRSAKFVDLVLILLALGLGSLLFGPLDHGPKGREQARPVDTSAVRTSKPKKTPAKSAEEKGRSQARIGRSQAALGSADSLASWQSDTPYSIAGGDGHQLPSAPEMVVPHGSGRTHGNGEPSPATRDETGSRASSDDPGTPDDATDETAPVATMTREELAQHLQQITGIADAMERQTALRELSHTLGPLGDLDLAAQTLASLSLADDQALFAREVVVALLNSNNPASAAQLIAQTGNTQLIMDNVGLIGNAWGAADPQAALDWAATLVQPQAVNLATNAIVFSWAEQDLDGAYDWVARLPDQQLKNDLLVRVGRAMADSDPLSAVEWAAQFADQKAQSELMSHALQLWAGTDMGAATTWIDEEMPSGATREQSINAVARQWAGTDPVAAFNWVTRAAAPESVNNIQAEVVSVWSRQDPDAAAKWIATLRIPAAVKAKLLP